MIMNSLKVKRIEVSHIAINPGSVELERQYLEGTGSNLRRSGRNRRLPDRYGVPVSDY